MLKNFSAAPGLSLPVVEAVGVFIGVGVSIGKNLARLLL